MLAVQIIPARLDVFPEVRLEDEVAKTMPSRHSPLVTLAVIALSLFSATALLFLCLELIPLLVGTRSFRATDQFVFRLVFIAFTTLALLAWIPSLRTVGHAIATDAIDAWLESKDGNQRRRITKKSRAGVRVVSARAIDVSYILFRRKTSCWIVQAELGQTVVVLGATQQESRAVERAEYYARELSIQLIDEVTSGRYIGML